MQQIDHPALLRQLFLHLQVLHLQGLLDMASPFSHLACTDLVHQWHVELHQTSAHQYGGMREAWLGTLGYVKQIRCPSILVCGSAGLGHIFHHADRMCFTHIVLHTAAVRT